MIDVWRGILTALTIFSFLTALPAGRMFLRGSGIVICAAALGSYAMFHAEAGSCGPAVGPVPQIVFALLTGLLAAAPLAVALELFSTTGHLIDLLRGSQFAEQMIGDDRASVLDTGVLLAGFCITIQSPRCFRLLALLLGSNRCEGKLAGLWDDPGLVRLLGRAGEMFEASVSVVFPLLCYVLIAELIFGILGRVSRRGSLNSELTPLRLAAALLFLTALPERLSEFSEGFLGYFL